jgi:hypothetical protein
MNAAFARSPRWEESGGPRHHVWGVLLGPWRLTAAGIGLGAVLALTLGRYVESQLYGIRGADLVTLAGAAGVLVALVLASGWLPARRASRVDPMVALRYE